MGPNNKINMILAHSLMTWGTPNCRVFFSAFLDMFYSSICSLPPPPLSPSFDNPVLTPTMTRKLCIHVWLLEDVPVQSLTLPSSELGSNLPPLGPWLEIRKQ